MKKKAHLKTGIVHTEVQVDTNTGEIVGMDINTAKYLASTKEEFWLAYATMLLFLKTSSDIKVKLFAALLERYGRGQTFSASKTLKDELAQECGCSSRSFDSSFTELHRRHVLVKLGHGAYRINPRHVFQGSSSDRNQNLKVILELHCPEC